jgi:hypothetical protein
MSLLSILESWTEGLVRIVIGVGLCWIGLVEGAGYGLFLGLVGVIFVVAGIGEIWAVEAVALRHQPRLRRRVLGCRLRRMAARARCRRWRLVTWTPTSAIGGGVCPETRH